MSPPFGGRFRLAAGMALIIAGLALACTGQAATYKSIGGSEVNLRAGPGTDHPRRFVVSRGYPVRVLETQQGWAKVEDFAGDVAWVAERLLSDERTVMVTEDLVNVREGPATDEPVAFRAKRHVLFTFLEKEGEWVQVRHADGDEGWVYAPLVWGD